MFFENEPSPEMPILMNKISFHIGAATGEAQDRIELNYFKIIALLG
jgi:hypothetical protein